MPTMSNRSCREYRRKGYWFVHFRDVANQWKEGKTSFREENYKVPIVSKLLRYPQQGDIVNRIIEL